MTDTRLGALPAESAWVLDPLLRGRAIAGARPRSTALVRSWRTDTARALRGSAAGRDTACIGSTRSAGWTAALGVDNLSNATYWVYHPYAGRTWFGELRWEL